MPDPVPRIPPFNPLDKRNLGESVADALLATDVHSLPPAPFHGAGIYAIYYTGSFPVYGEVANANHEERFAWPIYVGKAIPAGARKGGFGLGAEPGLVLYRRLAEHASSIEQAENLELADFRCRFLVVDDIWIPLGESLLVEMFHPLWNRSIDGFGNHDPGVGRKGQRRSQWDTLHPGRAWAKELPPANLPEERIREIAASYINQVSQRLGRGEL